MQMAGLRCNVTESLVGGLYAAGHLDFEADDFVCLQQEIARILDAPLHVRHIKLSASLQGFSGEFGMHDCRNLVIRSMYGKCAANLDVGRPDRCDLSFNLSGAKYDVGIFRGLKNFLVHPGVARLVSALATPCVHDDFAAGFAGGAVEAQDASRHGEGSVNRVEGAR